MKLSSEIRKKKKVNEEERRYRTDGTPERKTHYSLLESQRETRG